METKTAISAFAALSQGTRLSTLRSLLKLGATGATANDLASLVGVRRGTLSTELRILVRAGLVHHEKVGSDVVFAANLAAVEELASWLAVENTDRPKAEVHKFDAVPAYREAQNTSDYFLVAPTGRFPREPPQRLFRDRPAHVLFLCTGNSVRSIFCEAILNHWGHGRFVAYSAGSHPVGRVHRNALWQLRDVGISIGGLASKSWNRFAEPDAPPIDIVVTVCNSAVNETCPAFFGDFISTFWDIPDPAVLKGEEGFVRRAFADTFALIKECIDRLLTLPFQSLAPQDLQRQLDALSPVPEGQSCAQSTR